MQLLRNKLEEYINVSAEYKKKKERGDNHFVVLKPSNNGENVFRSQTAIKTMPTAQNSPYASHQTFDVPKTE